MLILLIIYSFIFNIKYLLKEDLLNGRPKYGLQGCRVEGSIQANRFVHDRRSQRYHCVSHTIDA